MPSSKIQGHLFFKKRSFEKISWNLRVPQLTKAILKTKEKKNLILSNFMFYHLNWITVNYKVPKIFMIEFQEYQCYNTNHFTSVHCWGKGFTPLPLRNWILSYPFVNTIWLTGTREFLFLLTSPCILCSPNFPIAWAVMHKVDPEPSGRNMGSPYNHWPQRATGLWCIKGAHTKGSRSCFAHLRTCVSGLGLDPD